MQTSMRWYITGNGFVAYLLFSLNIFWNTDKASVSRPACGREIHSDVPPSLTNMRPVTDLNCNLFRFIWIHNLFIELLYQSKVKYQSVRTSMRNLGLSGMNSLKISADDRLGTEQRTTKRRQLWKSNQPQWAIKYVLGITNPRHTWTKHKICIKISIYVWMFSADDNAWVQPIY